MTYDGTLASIRLDGGVLCLDFANTVHDRLYPDSPEYYHDYAELLAWAAYAGALSPDLHADLRALAERDPQAARQVYEESRSLREALFRLFAAAIEGTTAESNDLAILNAALGEALGALQVADQGGVYGWEWAGRGEHLASVLWPILRSAGDLLTSSDVERVKACPRCGWLFLDTSKNGRRRWCSMETCGNRAKASRHYSRAREPDGGE